MKLIVTTPTGQVGSRVVQLLIQAGVRPTVLLRDPDRLDPAVRALVDAVVVDQRDTDAVLRATRGADRLFWVNPPTTEGAAGYAALGATVARAVRDNGIGHTVFLSSVGAEKRHGAGEIDGLARTEELLDETSANVLHLRCGFFFTNLLHYVDSLRAGVLPAQWLPDLPMAWVDPRDIGDVATARLLSASWHGRLVQAVHGPTDLSFAQVSDIVHAATGHSIGYEQISDDTVRAGLEAAGFGAAQVEGIVGMAAGLREGFVAEDKRDVITTTPTTLASWAHEHLRPALTAQT